MKENRCSPGHLVCVCGVRGRDGAECFGSHPLVCIAPHQPCVVWTPTMPLTECLKVSPSSSLKMGKAAPASMTTWQVYMRLGCKNVSIPSFSFNIQKIRRLSLVCMKSSLGSQNLVQCLRQTQILHRLVHKPTRAQERQPLPCAHTHVCRAAKSTSQPQVSRPSRLPP